MIINSTRIIAPNIYCDEAWSEAEVLGGMIWLWSQHDYYRQSAIDSALDTILPIIRSKNFAFFVKNGQPLGYVNLVYLDADTEIKCIQKILSYEELLAFHNPKEDRHIWILSWFSTPNNNAHFTMYHLLKKYIFVDQKVRFIYHKSNSNSARIYTTYGNKKCHS